MAEFTLAVEQVLVIMIFIANAMEVRVSMLEINWAVS